jgi:hypothetical protein
MPEMPRQPIQHRLTSREDAGADVLHEILHAADEAAVPCRAVGQEYREQGLLRVGQPRPSHQVDVLGDEAPHADGPRLAQARQDL